MRKSYVEQVDQDRDARLRYEEVKDALDPSEAAKIERLRAEAETRPYNGYGHDLVSAIARGWRNKAAESIREAARCYALSATYGASSERPKPSIRLSGLLYLIIKDAANQGATAEDIRRVLQRELDCSDSTSIEKIVERAHG
jgi:hypothetical protein